MALDSIGIFVQAIAVALTGLAAYIAYLIYKSNKLSRGWLLIMATVVILGVRRIIDFVFIADSSQHPAVEFIDRPLIPLVVSFLFAAGFWFIKRDLDNADTIANMAREKIRRFVRHQSKALKK